MTGIPKKVFSQGLSILIILGLAFFLANNWQKFSSVTQLSVFHVTALAGIILITWALGSYQTVLLMRQAGVHVGFFEAVFLLVGMHLGNYLPMRAGTLIRMNYFKRVHNLQYITFSGLFSAKTLLMIASTSFLGCIGLAGLWFSNEKNLLPVLLFYSGVTVLSFVACIVPLPKKNDSQHFIGKSWNHFMEGYEAIRNNPKLLLQLIGLLLLQYLAFALRFWISFTAIGKELNPFVFLVLAPTTLFLSIFSLTPGNLGLREWLIGFLSVAVGLDLESGVFAGIIDRAVLMACTFVLGGFSLVYIRNRINQER